jgi:hypothetical protein
MPLEYWVARRRHRRKHTFAFPRHLMPEFWSNRCPSKDRGRRECRVLGTPAAARAKVESTRVSHYRHAETFRHSLRDGLRLMARSPRCTGLFSHRRSRIIFHELDPSVGGSGPRAFAVRPQRVRLAHQSVHRIPLPTFVTIGRSVPLGGDGMRTDNHILRKNGREIFGP